MAKTYYGYKRREGLQAIDYLGAAKDLTEGLTGIFEEREKERETIEEEIRKAEEEAKDVPMGDSSTLNEMVLDSSNGAAEALRVQAQLMRNGVIRPSEYTKFKQNTLDGVKDLKEGAASLNKNITDAKTAIDAGTASVSTMTFMEDAMKNTWFDRTRMYTDPKTGHLMIVRTDEKGKDIDGSETTMRNFKNQTKQIINRYDVEKETSSFTKTLGEDVRLALKDPNIKTIKDALQKTTIDPETGEEYTNFQLIDQWVESITDADAASILVDELGGKYSATGDVNEKGKAGKVYYKIDPTAANKNTRTADLTPEQRKAAEEYLKRNIYAQLDYVETPAPTTSGRETEAQKKRAGYVKQATKEIEVLAKLFEAKSPDDVNEVLTTYSEQIQKLGGQDFQSARVVGDELVVEYLNPIVEEGEPKMLEKRFKMPRDNFKDFVMTIGPAITGDDRLSGLYDEAVAGSDIDVDELVGGSSSGEFKITSPMPEFSEKESVIMNQFDDLDSYLNEANRNKDYISVADKYFDEFDIDGEASVSPDGVMTITANGITETVKLHEIDEDRNKIELKSTRRTDLKNALKRIHNKLRKGATTTGGAAGDDILGS